MFWIFSAKWKEVKSSLCLLQVKDVKDKIQAEKGVEAFPVEKQKLIYNGKVLENADPLSKYEINEKKFLVVMVPKPQAAPAKPAASTPTTEAAAAKPEAAASEKKEEKMEVDKKEDVKEPEKKEEEKKKESSTPTTPSAAPTGGEAGLNTADLVVGEDYNRMVQNIMDMGYGRDEVNIEQYRKNWKNISSNWRGFALQHKWLFQFDEFSVLVFFWQILCFIL